MPVSIELIRKSEEADLAAVLAIVNDAAQAYRGVIPADRWHEPYMPADELVKEIADGVVFWVAEKNGRLSGVMGIQDKGDVALVRHAYVAPSMQRKGVGTRLLRHVEGLVDKPILIGTWADASWAIDFYRKNGFTVVPNARPIAWASASESVEPTIPRMSYSRRMVGSNACAVPLAIASVLSQNVTVES